MSAVVPDCPTENIQNGGKGNTNSPPVKEEKSKKKTISASKRWCFTYNNYCATDLTPFNEFLGKNCSIVFYSKEKGESGTPHLQGYLEFKKRSRPKTVFKNTVWDTFIHWEKAKGSMIENYQYCSKDGPFFFYKGVQQYHPLKLITPDREYQKFILDLIKTEPDDRSIYWFYETVGNVGKTCFTKYLCEKEMALCLSGKASDVKNGVVASVEKRGTTPSLIVYDIPRSFNSDYLNYESLESIKSMMFYSGKYEGAQICGNPCHLIVFSNEPPDVEKLSKDRWKIFKIQKDFTLKEKKI